MSDRDLSKELRAYARHAENPMRHCLERAADRIDFLDVVTQNCLRALGPVIEESDLFDAAVSEYLDEDGDVDIEKLEVQLRHNKALRKEQEQKQG